MFCLNCGKALSDEAIFCAFCGRRIASTHQPSRQQPSGSVLGTLVKLLFAFVAIGAVVVVVGIILTISGAIGVERQRDWLGREKPIVDIKANDKGVTGSINLPKVERKETYNPPPDANVYYPPQSQNYNAPSESYNSNVYYPPSDRTIAPSQDIVAGSFPVEALHLRYFNFSVPNGSTGTVVGKFSATGGNNDINVLVMPASHLANFSNLASYSSYFNSGYSTARSFSVRVPPGEYVLVFNNRRSLMTNKIVTAFVEVRYE